MEVLEGPKTLFKSRSTPEHLVSFSNVLQRQGSLSQIPHEVVQEFLSEMSRLELPRK